ncbi:MAG: L-rhamnose mutarotase [Verrucomicrobiota bacterium]
MKRYGSVIGLRPEKLAEYKQLHAAVWPEILAKIKESHIHNYSIFLRQLPDGNHHLFSYFEYTGTDTATDSARMAADPKTQEWWALCKPCQKPLANCADGEWWADMEEVFHAD